MIDRDHHFNVGDAVLYGIEKAILLQNIRYWLDKNKANRKNEFDGYYWTYNSSSAFAELFPYMSAKKIARLLKELENDGLLLVGNYNKSAYDRTKWYSMSEFSTSQNGNIHFPNLSNELPKIEQPIPDINTDKKQDNKQYLSDKPKKAQLDWSLCPDLTNEDIAEIKTIRGKNKLTQRVVNSICKEINLSLNAGATIDNILTLWGEKGWRAYKHEWAVNATQANQPNNNYQANGKPSAIEMLRQRHAQPNQQILIGGSNE